jgi:hypothetical protein
MNAHEPPRKLPHAGAKLQPLTSESRVIRSNVIGGWINGRSAEGRFLAKCERELVAEIGGSTTFAQKMLIRRAARAGGLCRPEPDSAFPPMYTITAFLGHGRPESVESRCGAVTLG